MNNNNSVSLKDAVDAFAAKYGKLGISRFEAGYNTIVYYTDDPKGVWVNVPNTFLGYKTEMVVDKKPSHK